MIQIEEGWRKIIYESLPWKEDGIIIRASRGDDARLFCELLNEQGRYRYLGGPIKSDIAEKKNELEDNPYLYYVININNQLIGYTLFIENNNTDGIDILIVILSKLEGKWYPRKVLSLMIAKWKEIFPTKLIAITTQAENRKVILLLERYGFYKSGEYTNEIGTKHYIYRLTTPSI
jgi:RimJ/RimL family protein N-acetyltransferase